jgi:hypothetical protein
MYSLGCCTFGLIFPILPSLAAALYATYPLLVLPLEMLMPLVWLSASLSSLVVSKFVRWTIELFKNQIFPADGWLDRNIHQLHFALPAGVLAVLIVCFTTCACVVGIVIGVAVAVLLAFGLPLLWAFLVSAGTE